VYTEVMARVASDLTDVQLRSQALHWHAMRCCWCMQYSLLHLRGTCLSSHEQIVQPSKTQTHQAPRGRPSSFLPVSFEFSI
jgi:hypothetical protein